MAFIAVINNLPMIRREAHAPGNTGGGNPRPTSTPIIRVIRGKPNIRIRPKCTPRAFSYPKHTSIPVGPFGRGRYHLLRYACLKTTTRMRRALTAIKMDPASHPLPIDDLPISLIERNPSPVSGRAQVPYRRAQGLKQSEII